MAKFTLVALVALLLGSAVANAAPRGDAAWPTDWRVENSGDFQLAGR